ncbi:hypothetical protein V2J09_009304 [Rumex salicifolius]
MPSEMATSPPIQTDTFKLGFIGAGKMAESIARGVVTSGVLPASRISTAHLAPQRRKAFQSFGVTLFDHNQQVFLLLTPALPPSAKSKISNAKILTGLSTVDLIIHADRRHIEEWAGNSRFVRVMPNTPAAVGQAASVISRGGTATEEDVELIMKLFGAIGKVWKAEEKHFDAITGLSGSGPAYIFLAIEALADGGVAAGLPRDLALGLASQTVLGAATMVVETGKHPGQLKDDVASPGGTTIAGIHELEKGGFRGILMNTVVAAAKRGKELSPK